MVLGISVWNKCAYCGKKLDRNNLKQIVKFCGKECKTGYKKALKEKKKRKV